MLASSVHDWPDFDEIPCIFPEIREIGLQRHVRCSLPAQPPSRGFSGSLATLTKRSRRSPELRHQLSQQGREARDARPDDLEGENDSSEHVEDEEVDLVHEVAQVESGAGRAHQVAMLAIAKAYGVPLPRLAQRRPERSLSQQPKLAEARAGRSRRPRNHVRLTRVERARGTMLHLYYTVLFAVLAANAIAILLVVAVAISGRKRDDELDEQAALVTWWRHIRRVAERRLPF